MIEHVVREVRAADERENVARRRVDRHERAFERVLRVAPADLREPARERRVGRALLAHRDRRRHVQAERVGVVMEALDHHPARALGDVRRGEDAGRRRGRERDRRVGGLPVRGLVQIPERAHAAEHVVAAHRRPRRIDDRIERGRRLRQAREHRRLAGRERIERLAEVHRRGRREPVRALAEIDLVHVQLEQLVLAVRAFELVRHQDLGELAAQHLLARQKEIARDLHRDRAAALPGLAGDGVRHRRAREPADVDRAVRVELRILGREQRVPHERRDAVERHELATLDAVFGEQLAFARKDPQRQRRTIDGERLDGRQCRPDAMQRPRADRAARDRRAEHEARERAEIAAALRRGPLRRRRRGGRRRVRRVIGHVEILRWQMRRTPSRGCCSARCARAHCPGRIPIPIQYLAQVDYAKFYLGGRCARRHASDR
ncbi:Uncharacterised protein [Burkholderia pseudomallei]|nr:Uncharacterised protein [Burkholderia pseudomallei]